MTSIHSAEAPIAVYEKHLFTPDQLVIGTYLDGDFLGPFVLVADAATFKKKAAMDRGRLMLVADMPIHPGALRETGRKTGCNKTAGCGPRGGARFR